MLQAQVDLMANELFQGFQELENLILQLPDKIPNQNDAEEIIVQQNEQTKDSLTNLRHEVKVAEEKLVALQKKYEGLSNIILHGQNIDPETK